MARGWIERARLDRSDDGQDPSARLKQVLLLCEQHVLRACGSTGGQLPRVLRTAAEIRGQGRVPGISSAGERAGLAMETASGAGEWSHIESGRRERSRARSDAQGARALVRHSEERTIWPLLGFLSS